MQTYKAFLKITLKNLPSMALFFIIFMVISIIGTSQSSDSAEEIYKDKEIRFTVFNRDDSKLGEAIKDYLSKTNEYVEIEDSDNALRVALYYRDIYYAVVIPEGFEEAISNGKDMELMNYKVMDSAMGYYMDMAVEGYMQTLKAYVAAGYEIDEATVKSQETLLKSVDVNLTSNMENEKTYGNTETGNLSEKPMYYYFYQYIPYIFLAVVISGLGPIIITFNKKDVKKRINVSAQSFKSFAFQMFLGVTTLGVSILVLFNTSAYILYGKDLSLAAMVYYVITSLCFLMVCLGISFLGGFLFTNTATMGGFANVVSLGFSFLGGIFVPLELLGDTMKNIAKYTPTYWYIQTNNAIVGIEKFSDINMNEYISSLSIQLLFALAFFCIGLVVLKYKREEA